MALLEIKDLSFTYALNTKASLENINLKIEAGEFVVICGSTGSGKSTLLKMLKREIRPRGEMEGSISFNGDNLDNLSDYESVKNFGYVMQSPSAQIVSERVYSELAFGLENLGLASDKIAIRIAEIANYFGINKWYNLETSSLSGGEMQILNLASVLAMNPEVLLIDEPTAYLDPITASEFIQTIKKINQDFGLTILMVEHRVDEVFALCDQVIVMDAGKIIAKDRPREVGKSIEDERLFLSLPTLFRISKKLKINTYPLTIKEGQQLMLKYENKVDRLPQEKQVLKNEILNLKNIYFKYAKDQVDVLEDLNLKIYKNEIFTIVGSNGSGKSTLLKLLANLLTPYYGGVYYQKKNLKKYKANDLYYNNLAYLPQNPQDIFFKMTVREELSDFKVSNDELNQIFKKLEIEPLLDKHPDDLSGGELQKVGFAKILLQKPQVILLDEPTKGFDSYLKSNLIEILTELRKMDITIIIVSHDIEFAARVSTRIGLLFAGKIYALNDSNTFFSNNYFYTTITNKISRSKYQNAITEEDLISLIELNGGI